MAKLFLFITTLLLVTSSAWAGSQCDLHYTVTPRYGKAPRRLDVVLSFPAEGRQESWLRMPSGWAGVENFGAALTPASDQQEGVKIFPTDDANRWKVEHHPVGRVIVSYQIRAALDDPDNEKVQPQDQRFRPQIGADWFQFFGYGALPSVESWEDRRIGNMCLTLLQPAEQPGPLLGSYLDGQVRDRADIEFLGTFAQLRHAFYAGGLGWRVVKRTLAESSVVTASRGTQALDDASFAAQVTNLLEAHRRFWGDTSTTRQTVVRTPNNSLGSYGGTLVHQAAVLHVPKDFAPGSDSFEFLIGHENLHQWVPNRLGAHGTGSAVDQARNYWLSEGFTDYYAHRLLLASGLWSLDRYAQRVTRVLRGYWSSPARNATAESIAPRFFSDRDAGRQMYARGELLAMAWDRELRVKSPLGLDGLLRGLMLSSEQAEKSETAHERVLNALTNELGPAPRAQLRAYVMEGRDFDLDDGLAGPCFALGWSDLPRWTLGFDMASLSSGKYKAAGVIVDGPAYMAGLREGMDLKGWSIDRTDITKEVILKVKAENGEREMRYLPVNGSTDRVPTLMVRSDAAIDATCQAWIRR